MLLLLLLFIIASEYHFLFGHSGFRLKPPENQYRNCESAENSQGHLK